MLLLLSAVFAIEAKVEVAPAVGVCFGIPPFVWQEGFVSSGISLYRNANQGKPCCQVCQVLDVYVSS